MNSTAPESSRSQYNVLDPAPHTLYQCRSVEEFRVRFEATTGRSVQQITEGLTTSDTPRAIFSVGSIPLGMGTRGSDVDVIVLIDSRETLSGDAVHAANNSQHASFVNENDALLGGVFIQLLGGVLVDVQVAMIPAIRDIYTRLRRRSPELNEIEIRILGRLRTGWLLWETDGYLERNAVDFNDRTLAVYCCTRNFVAALTHQRKAAKALELNDVPLVLHLGRSSVEMAYLAYFASEGFLHLGVKWLAQLGFAQGAQERLARHPLLKQNLQLLFPGFSSTQAEAAQYLREVGTFLTSIRGMIEKQVLFRIAFSACPQIAAA